MRATSFALAIVIATIGSARAASAADEPPLEEERAWHLGFEGGALVGVTAARTLPKMTIDGAKLGEHPFPIPRGPIVEWDFMQGRFTYGPSNGLYLPLFGGRVSFFSLPREMTWFDGVAVDTSGGGLNLLVDLPGVGVRRTRGGLILSAELLPSVALTTYSGTLARNSDSAQESFTARAIYFSTRVDLRACGGGETRKARYAGVCAFAAPALVHLGAGAQLGAADQRRDWLLLPMSARRLLSLAVLGAASVALGGACEGFDAPCDLPGVTSHYGGSIALLATCPDAKTPPGSLPPSCGGAAIADVRIAAFYPYRSGECSELVPFVVRVVTFGDRPDDCILHAVPQTVTHDTGKSSGYGFRSATARIEGGTTCTLSAVGGAPRLVVGDGKLSLTPGDMNLTLFGLVDGATAQLSFDGRRGATDPPP